MPGRPFFFWRLCSGNSRTGPGEVHSDLPQVRCMQLQQLVSSLQQQNLTIQQQIKATKAENEILADRNRALEFQLKSYEQMFSLRAVG
jgi:hypothetical protein